MPRLRPQAWNAVRSAAESVTTGVTSGVKGATNGVTSGAKAARNGVKSGVHISSPPSRTMNVRINRDTLVSKRPS
jgi:phage-related protein